MLVYSRGEERIQPTLGSKASIEELCWSDDVEGRSDDDRADLGELRPGDRLAWLDEAVGLSEAARSDLDDISEDALFGREERPVEDPFFLEARIMVAPGMTLWKLSRNNGETLMTMRRCLRRWLKI